MSWQSNDTKKRKLRPMFYSVRSSGHKAYAKLTAMVEEDAPVVSKLLISYPEDTMLSEPTPEMRFAYVADITSGSATTQGSSQDSSPKPGRRNTTTKSTKKASSRRSSKTSTGKSVSTSSHRRTKAKQLSKN